MIWEVTTAQTAYEVYVVEAETAEDAKRIVSDSPRRADLPSRAAPFDAGDEEIIDVRSEVGRL